MLNFTNQESHLDYVFTTSQLNEMLYPSAEVEISEYEIDESFEIDEMQIDKIYQCL